MDHPGQPAANRQRGAVVSASTTVRADVSLPASDFLLGETLGETPAVRFELERGVPSGQAVAPYLWATGRDLDDIEGRLLADGDVAAASILDQVEDEALVRVEWAPSAARFVEPLAKADGLLLDAVSVGRRWDLQLRFADRAALGDFYRHRQAAGHPFTLDGVRQPALRGPAALPLSAVQRETLGVAFESGYFEVPRRMTLEDLADELGVSDTAVSQRLRRGLGVLVGALVSDPERDRTD